jgi:hypothetical protein
MQMGDDLVWPLDDLTIGPVSPRRQVNRYVRIVLHYFYESNHEGTMRTALPDRAN